MPEHELTHHEAEGLHFATCSCGWRSHLCSTRAEIALEFTHHKETA